MPNFAQATIVGHLGRDPSTKQVGSGTVTEFVVAVNPAFPKDSPTMWIDCKVWGKKGEVIAEYHSKGDAILVTGALRSEEWEANDGSGKRSKMVVDVNDFSFVKSGEGQGQQPKATASNDYGHQPVDPVTAISHDDIPF